MKKLIAILFFIMLPLFAVAQNDTVVASETVSAQTTTSSDVKTTKAVKPAVIKSAQQVKAINLNHKKSFELISIKAYRKSLQIKVKTVKNC